MNCPQCQHPLIESKVGKLCLNCGRVHDSQVEPAQILADQHGSVPIAPLDDEVTAPPSLELPTPKRSRWPKKRWAQAAVVVIILICAGLVYVLPAWAEANSFKTKLNNTTGFSVSGNLTMQANSFLTILKSNLDFSGQVDKNNNRQQLGYSGIFGSRSYTGTATLTGDRLFSQMQGSDLPFIRYNQGASTLHLNSGQMYSTKLDNSLYKYYCETRPDTKYPSGLKLAEAFGVIKLQPSPLVLYDQTIDGHRATRLSGQVDSKTVAAAWAKFNAALPDGCQIELVIDDLSQLKINYDLWTSHSYDQIALHLSDDEVGLKGSLTLKLSHYNQPANITAPTNALDLADLFSQRAAIQARDYQRRADIDQLSQALKAYYAATKTLPSSLSKLAPKYIGSVPKDPNGGSYSYSVTKKTYTLQGTLEDNGANYEVSGP